MKIQIYAAILAVMWALSTMAFTDEARRNHYSSDAQTPAFISIVSGAVLLPLLGRVWGWW
jgi:hypothetical protein